MEQLMQETLGMETGSQPFQPPVTPARLEGWEAFLFFPSFFQAVISHSLNCVHSSGTLNNARKLWWWKQQQPGGFYSQSPWQFLALQQACCLLGLAEVLLSRSRGFFICNASWTLGSSCSYREVIPVWCPWVSWCKFWAKSLPQRALNGIGRKRGTCGCSLPADSLTGSTSQAGSSHSQVM